MQHCTENVARTGMVEEECTTNTAARGDSEGALEKALLNMGILRKNALKRCKTWRLRSSLTACQIGGS